MLFSAEFCRIYRPVDITCFSILARFILDVSSRLGYDMRRLFEIDSGSELRTCIHDYKSSCMQKLNGREIIEGILQN